MTNKQQINVNAALTVQSSTSVACTVLELSPFANVTRGTDTSDNISTFASVAGTPHEHLAVTCVTCIWFVPLLKCGRSDNWNIESWNHVLEQELKLSKHSLFYGDSYTFCEIKSCEAAPLESRM